MNIRENVELAPYTTLRLGGKARYIATCASTDDVYEALAFARAKALPVHILGGGSNTIFADKGYPGLVMHMTLKGVQYHTAGDSVEAGVQAGEVWDVFVAQCVEQGYAGIECLSGIPGFIGATPLQNVGAYGQAVSDTITRVTALNMVAGKLQTFSNKECRFGYRTSRFKKDDAGCYIIISVTYKLRRDGEPTIKYPQIRAKLGEQALNSLGRGHKALRQVREAALELRRSKSMVVDENDPNTRSCGSFFVNPILSPEDVLKLKERVQKQSGTPADIPVFPEGNSVKVSAAWLIEHVGFKRGQRRNGVGISANHALALVNYNGTAKDLLAFADEIGEKVREEFGISLEREPVVVT